MDLITLATKQMQGTPKFLDLGVKGAQLIFLSLEPCIQSLKQIRNRKKHFIMYLLLISMGSVDNQMSMGRVKQELESQMLIHGLGQSEEQRGIM